MFSHCAAARGLIIGCREAGLRPEDITPDVLKAIKATLPVAWSDDQLPYTSWHNVAQKADKIIRQRGFDKRLSGTMTGRMSVSQPNLQQLPRSR